jgi:hypothetical protein
VFTVCHYDSRKAQKYNIFSFKVLRNWIENGLSCFSGSNLS